MCACLSGAARENGILKHQLKNYVSAVQQLRHGSPHEILEQLQREQRTSEQQALHRHEDYHAEAEAYQAAKLDLMTHMAECEVCRRMW